MEKILFKMAILIGRLRRTMPQAPLVALGLIVLCITFALSVKFARMAGAESSRQDHPRSSDGVWQEIEASLAQIRETGDPPMPQRYRAFRLDQEALRERLGKAPMEFSEAAKASPAEITLPMPNGKFTRFRMEESPILSPELAVRYSTIKNYRGFGLDDPAATMRCEWSPWGFSALILTRGETVAIHAARPGENAIHLSYHGRDFQSALEDTFCHVARASQIDAIKENAGELPGEVATGDKARTYRIAIATTQEYTNDPQLGGGSEASTAASLNRWLSRVNVIFERDLSIRLVLSAAVIFTKEDDGFTNGDADQMANRARTVFRDEVGEANYDLGHVLGVGESGRAVQRAVCDSRDRADKLGPIKGAGASLINTSRGISFPTGLFAHELGHQFGASHTFNGTNAGCDQKMQRAPEAAYEPGGGSTLMAYPLRCGSDAVETDFDLRFHASSLSEINSYLSTDAKCRPDIPTNNSIPTVNAGLDYTIPRNTPFTLTAQGKDADAGDASRLTYVWEQIDAANDYFNPPYTDEKDPSTTTRPIFRAFAASSRPARTFPRWTYILEDGNDPPDLIATSGGIVLRSAEELPRIGRKLNFRATVRDGRGGVGQDSVALTVDGSSGPFTVTQPALNAIWPIGTKHTVTWNVANTTNAPISCSRVRISLIACKDCDQTKEDQKPPDVVAVLSTSTPNDGSEEIVVPALPLFSRVRVKVEAVGNIFFDASDGDISIVPSAELSIIKSADTDTVVAGTSFNYTITVKNNGPSIAAPISPEFVEVADRLPRALEFESVNDVPRWRFSQQNSTNTIRFRTEYFEPGQAATFNVRVHVAPFATDGSTLDNTATITSTTFDPNPANNLSAISTRVITRADLQITAFRDAPDPVVTNTPLTYTITLRNNGPSGAIAVNLVDNLPFGAIFESCGSSIDGMCGGSGQNRSVIFEALDPGKSETIRIVTTASCALADGAVILNTVTVHSATIDPEPANNSRTTTTRASNPPPIIDCPASRDVITTMPGSLNAIVAFPAPTVTDNCPDPMVICSPPSGSSFPLGTTNVTCTATDSGGAMASCSFNVTIWDASIQDDESGDYLLFNSFTGEYAFHHCGPDAFTMTGRGFIRREGCVTSLRDDTRVVASFDRCRIAPNNTGHARIKRRQPDTTFALDDRDILNNLPSCSPITAPAEVGEILRSDTTLKGKNNGNDFNHNTPISGPRDQKRR